MRQNGRGAPPRRRRTLRAGAVAAAAMLIGLLGAGAEVLPPPQALAGVGGAGPSGPPGAWGHFEPNLGQFPGHVRFVVRGVGTEAFLTDEGATFVLREAAADGVLDVLHGPLEAPFADAFTDPIGYPEPAAPASLLAVFLRFEDAEAGPMEGTEDRPGISNHFIGNDPDKWVTDVPHHGRVVQRDVWPGIDIEWHIASGGLKFDAVVHPGADPNLVRFTLPGAAGLSLGAAGDLLIATPLGNLVKEAPYSYQPQGAGEEAEVPSRYVLDGGAVGFEVDGHDATRVLVIDPLVYSTYLGGGSQDIGYGIAVDVSGSAYVAGATASGDFPTESGFQTAHAGDWDAFVTKLSPGGDALVYSTYLGGSGSERSMTNGARNIAVDPEGNAYIVGTTRSDDFPLQSPYQATKQNDHTAFVTKLAPAGNALVYSTYLGGLGAAPGRGDGAFGVALDDEGHAYVTGWTESPDFPTTPLAFSPTPGGLADAFVTKFSPDGDTLIYSTYLDGGSLDQGRGVAVDAEGSAYVVGDSQSFDFPTTSNAFQRERWGGPECISCWDAFVTKLSPDGRFLEYSTYLSTSGLDRAGSIVVDDEGHAHVQIHTSGLLPTTQGAFQEDPRSSSSLYIAKFMPEGDGLVYGSYLGGTGNEGAFTGLALDAAGSLHVTGGTQSTDFPMENPYMATKPSGWAVFVSKFTPEGDRLTWSTYLGGGGGQDVGYGIAVDGAGSAYVTGLTDSSDFPTTPGALQRSPPGGFWNTFVAKLYGVLADFDWSDVCPGEPVTFRDLTISHTGRPVVRTEWDFGDGSDPRVLEPGQVLVERTYAEEGTYEVSLAATDADGNRGVATRAVTVPWCPPPNHAPSLVPLPCVGSSPGQRVSFRVEATVPVLPGDPPSYSDLSFFSEGLPVGASLLQEGDFAARFAWEVGAPDTYTFVVQVEDGGLPEHGVPSLGDSKEYCVRSLPDKPAPGRDDASGDGVQNWHDACPHAKNPDQGDAAGDGLDDPCDPAAVPEAEETPAAQGPPPGGCPSQPAGPREVTARWTDGAVQVSWQSDSWCPPDHFLVWNGTGHHLVDFIPAEIGVHYVVLNTDPWPEPHQYYVQAMGADEGLFFDPTRAVASNLIDPAGCAAEGARSEACLPVGPPEEPPAAVEPAGPEAAAPADGTPVGLIAAAAALVVAGLTALLWRLRHAPWVVHLFTRLGRDDVLDHPARRQIMELVVAEPGIHYAEILRRGGGSRGAARHHLKVLMAAGVLRRRRAGRYVCYYPLQGPPRSIREVGGLLRTDLARRLLRLLYAEPGLAVVTLAGRLGVDERAVRYHLRRFEEGGLARMEREAQWAKAYPGELTKDALATLS